MSERRPSGPPDPPPEDTGPDFESYPLTRNEYISAMVHFYRAEMARADTWRTRLDATTNWAVVVTAGILSFSYGNPGSPHVVVLLANLFTFAFLCLEARRFRIFDVWRSRCRMLEENFYVPVIRRDLTSPMSDWRSSVAEDLDHPTFKFSFAEALSHRLRMNYLWMFYVVLAAWLFRLGSYPEPAGSALELFARMQVGVLPAWLVGGFVAVSYGALSALALLWHGRRRLADEIAGMERRLDHWKV